VVSSRGKSMKTLLLTLTALAGLTMAVAISQANDPETTATTSSDGKSRTAISGDYTHAWGKYSLDKSTLPYNQEAPAATPSQNSVGSPYSSPAEPAPQLYARPAPTPAPVSSMEMLPPKSVVSVINSNRWTAAALIVAGTLTNTNAVPVRITKISATGFNRNKKAVIDGSDFTIVHNELAPGETVNFKVALKDDAKQVKFVKVTPYVVGP
jgi:hypothetical protein